jgi:uncharacterized membrane protein
MLSHRDRSDLNEMREVLTASIKRRLLMWVVRWTLGFAAIAVTVYFRPGLSWLFLAGAGVAAASLIVMLSMYAFARRRLEVGRQRLDDYEVLWNERDSRER